MRAVLFISSLFLAVGCATGQPATDLVAAHKDGGIIAKGDGGSTHDSGTQQTTTCGDTTSDPVNCGACGVACASGETCSNGQCTSGGTTTTSNAPPQGTCSHALCTSGAYLDEGCDTAGCTVIICDPSYLADDYCCTTSWDSQCEQEVTTYCSPYSCN